MDLDDTFVESANTMKGKCHTKLVKSKHTTITLKSVNNHKKLHFINLFSILRKA